MSGSIRGSEASRGSAGMEGVGDGSANGSTGDMAKAQTLGSHDVSAAAAGGDEKEGRESWLEARTRATLHGRASGKWREAMHATAEQARQGKGISPRQESTDAYETWKTLLNSPQLEEQLAGTRNLWDHKITHHSSRSPPFGAPSSNKIIGMSLGEC